MGSKRRIDYYCRLFILTCFFCFHSSVAGSNTLTVGQVMRDYDSLQSSNMLFQLHFDSLGPQSMRYLVIHYVGGQGPWKAVWVANPGNPIEDSSGALNIDHDGNLVLTSRTGTVVLTMNSSSSSSSSSNTSTSATLLDTGNLVLRVGKRTVWQSFDYPSDTWVPGMKLGLLFKSSTGRGQQRFLTSWVSTTYGVPIMGAFTLGVDPNNTKQLVILKRGIIYWRSGMWNGYNFSDSRNLANDASFSNISFSYFSDESQSYFTFTATPTSTSSKNYGKHIPWIALDSIGEIRISVSWDQDRSPAILTCDESLSSEKSKGCVVAPGTYSNCTFGDEFIEKTRSSLYSLYSELYNNSLVISDCKDMCTKDCSCTGFASSSPFGTGCVFSDGTTYGDGNDTIYIRKGSPNFPPSPNNFLTNHSINTTPNNSRKWKVWVTIGATLVFLVIPISVSLMCSVWWRKRHVGGNNARRSKDGTNQSTLFYELKTKATLITKINNGNKDYELSWFSLSCIEIATDYFSDANKIGQGGFGPVYKGKLVNEQEIAVKRLSKSSGQGLEEFKNEVLLISRLQHRNLVRLLGCCAEGDERILIYEYLSNKSLDTFIFDVTGHASLDWKMRVSIIEGIAQGLQYLHKYSRVRIIHRDLKTSNILLDKNMNPKISDFGTARIFGDNESQANTKRIVGTCGYMSPEYALDGLFSVKSDIFSFGVMMLEIISGKKNTGFYQPDRALNLLGYAWDLWNEGRSLEIIDHTLTETCSTIEVMRYIQVSFLCVQEHAADRPTISDVVSMLSNEMIIIPAPKQPAFSAIVSMNYTPEIQKPCSVNDVTISDVKGR